MALWQIRDDADMLARLASFGRDGDGRLNQSEDVDAERMLAAERIPGVRSLDDRRMSAKMLHFD